MGRACTLALAIALVGLASVGSHEAAEETPVWSTQLHLHGSFSEGVGSIEGHTRQAAELGVDVLWWSDHDYNVGSYRLVSTFGFEAEEEPIDAGEPWKLRLRREDAYRKSVSPSELSSGKGQYEFTAERALEGERSLRVRTQPRQGRFRSFLLEWAAKRGLHRRTVATGVRLELAVFPERLGPDARALVHLELSEHSPSFEQHALRYYLAAEGAAPPAPHREGTTYFVPLEYEPGRWNEYSLDVSADCRRGFPEVPAGDDLIFRVAFGVESRSGAEASALFDRLRVTSRRVGADGLAAQRELLAGLGPATATNPTQLQGLELSYEAYHLNEFTVDTPLPDYEAWARESELAGEDGRVDDMRAFRGYVTRRAVAGAQERGGLASYNHMFGASFEAGGEKQRDRAEVLAWLIEEQVFGADVLEVGYRERGGADLSDHLWVWDRLAEAGLRLVGTGVSDYHGGLGAGAWRTMDNNFVSWIYAARPEKAELIEGLRAGRVFFGDIAHFDGRVDLTTARGFRMGDVVLTDREGISLSALVSGLTGGERVRIVGSQGVLAEDVASGPEHTLSAELHTDARANEFARVEVHAEDGAALVFSNPIWFVRAGEEASAPLARGRFDIGGVREVSGRGVALIGAREVGAEPRGVELSLAASEGAFLVLDPGRDLSGVDFAGLEGTATMEPGQVRLSELRGRGKVTLRW
jgi:hypothetical protein